MPPVSLPVGMRREIHQLRKGGGGGGRRPLPLNKEAEKEWGAGVRVVQPETPTSLCFADSLLARPLTEDRQTGK